MFKNAGSAFFLRPRPLPSRCVLLWTRTSRAPHGSEFSSWGWDVLSRISGRNRGLPAVARPPPPALAAQTPSGVAFWRRRPCRGHALFPGGHVQRPFRRASPFRLSRSTLLCLWISRSPSWRADNWILCVYPFPSLFSLLTVRVITEKEGLPSVVCSLFSARLTAFRLAVSAGLSSLAFSWFFFRVKRVNSLPISFCVCSVVCSVCVCGCTRAYRGIAFNILK